MDELLNAISALVKQVSKERLLAVAIRIRGSEPNKLSSSLGDVVRTPLGAQLVSVLISTWQATNLSSDELASMLIAAAHTYEVTSLNQTVDFVWTGPTTPGVSARRTAQALLQVTNSAKRSLFLTSFVVFDVATVMASLDQAVRRGVEVKVLLESSLDFLDDKNGGAVSKMRSMLPAVKLYYWGNKSQEFAEGRVHSKIAVSDSRLAFVTSANLTGHAMEKNMEAGVLIEGEGLPRRIQDHLEALITTGIILEV